MADKYVTLISGEKTLVEATTSSAGAGNAGDIIALDGAGKIALNMLPTGVGPDIKSVVVGSNVTAGQFVNVYNNAGTLNCRPADSTNSRPAHGFVKATVTATNPVDVYFEGVNSDRSGLTVGARYYLTSGGNVTTTAPSSPTDQIHQYIGVALSATEIAFEADDYIKL